MWDFPYNSWLIATLQRLERGDWLNVSQLHGQASSATSGSMGNLNSGWGHNLLAGVFQYGCTTRHLEKLRIETAWRMFFVEHPEDGLGQPEDVLILDPVVANWPPCCKMGWWVAVGRAELKWQILLGSFWYGPSKLMIGIFFLVVVFFCLVLVPLNISIYYDIGLRKFEQRHWLKPSCHRAIAAYIQTAQPLCTEDVVRGWSRRSARSARWYWILGTSKETSYSSSPGRSWGLLSSGHFSLMKWTGSLFDSPSGQSCLLEKCDNMECVFIFLYFSCKGKANI